jgi:hypothetical protein
MNTLVFSPRLYSVHPSTRICTRTHEVRHTRTGGMQSGEEGYGVVARNEDANLEKRVDAWDGRTAEPASLAPGRGGAPYSSWGTSGSAVRVTKATAGPGLSAIGSRTRTPRLFSRGFRRVSAFESGWHTWRTPFTEVFAWLT